MTDFERHYSELFDYVYRYVFVRLKDAASTDDLVSSIFLSAFEKQHQYDSEKGTWRQWITGIARNAVFHHWKTVHQHFDLEEVSLSEALETDHLEELRKWDQKVQFQKIMDSVIPEIRMLLVLRYEEDLTYDDIAELLKKTPAAVRKTFSRLHQQLRAQCGDFID